MVFTSNYIKLSKNNSYSLEKLSQKELPPLDDIDIEYSQNEKPTKQNKNTLVGHKNKASNRRMNTTIPSNSIEESKDNSELQKEGCYLVFNKNLLPLD